MKCIYNFFTTPLTLALTCSLFLTFTHTLSLTLKLLINRFLFSHQVQQFVFYNKSIVSSVTWTLHLCSLFPFSFFCQFYSLCLSSSTQLCIYLSLSFSILANFTDSLALLPVFCDFNACFDCQVEEEESVVSCHPFFQSQWSHGMEEQLLFQNKNSRPNI